MSDGLMPIDFRQINIGQGSNGAKKPENAVSGNGVANEKSNAVNTQGQQDSVELSSKAKLVQTLLSDMSNLPEVNQSRVEQIRASIASGEFTVSAEQVAGKMLALEDGLRKLS